MTLTLEESDVRPMDSFPLKWRWTDVRWNLLPAEDLARITPLTEAKATQLRRYTGKWFAGNGLDTDRFTVSERDRQHNADQEMVRAWLSEQMHDKEEKLWVSFDNLRAVATDAEIFCRYWDDFCYPGGWNVLIWPFSESWLLYYFHEETFYLGQKAGTTAKGASSATATHSKTTG